MNTDDLEPALLEAERRVQKIQTKLHRWADEDPHRRFDDLFNLVTDPAFLLVAWDRVRGNKGARTAGVDGRTARSIQVGQGVGEFLDGLRASLKDRSFRPLPVRERMIPKSGGKLRRLGIVSVRDRVVQSALRIVLEPILEADFLPCSFGFRPRRSAHQALEAIRQAVRGGRTWVVDADIESFFDRLGFDLVLDCVRERVSDRRVLRLVGAVLRAGVLEGTVLSHPEQGAPQGGAISPVLANTVLHRLDRAWTARYQRLGCSSATPTTCASAVRPGSAPRPRWRR